MAGISCYIAVSSTSNYKRIYTIRSCSNPPTNNSKIQTPSLLKFAVSGVTEVLRMLSAGNNGGMDKVMTKEKEEFSVSGVDDVLGILKSDYDNAYFVCRMDKVMTKEKEEFSVSGVDDVLGILKSDYDNAYFVTGTFSSSIYAGDCLFEDPTIKFRGTELYSRNIQLLVPFFEQPSIVLKTIDKSVNSDRDFVLATWSLRTYLQLPWRPLIAVEGSTIYDLNDEYKIVRHAESWNISALEAVGQIFTPGSRRSLE